ncbi:MAG: aminodeoxychorismate lyase [Hydrogenophilales bacterium]|nr:aminodeoxychorismate lyase [Hydrogenophilales bacterium]
MIIINGQQGNSIHVMDRSVMYGDGVFRTMRMRDGRVSCWLGQYRKLEADCRALDIPCPARSTLAQEIELLARDTPDCVVKIVVSRGEGGRGYGVPDSVSPNRVVLTAPLPIYPENFRRDGVRLHVCELRLCHQPRLAGIKHLNRLENVLARMEWSDPDTPEGLMLDAEGWVVEGTMANIFMRQGNTLLTPDLSACGVAGLQRERILQFAPQCDLVPEVRNFSLPMLLQAEEVFLCNSVIGVWPVRQIGENPIPLGAIAAQMQHFLESETV